jgi:periplasmic protein CpxP/Spy
MTLRSTVVLIVVVCLIGAGAAWAQAEEPEHMHHTHGEFMGGHGLGLPLHELNLTDDQRTQIHQIFKSEHANMKPLMVKEMQSHQQLMELITSGNFDQAKATAIAAQESQTHVQLEVEHARIASQIYQLLNSEQKAKVAELMAKHQERMEQHLENHETSPDQK